MFCGLLAAYLYFVLPTGQPMWSSMGLAEHEIQRADLSQLQTDLRSAVTSLAKFRHEKNALLLLCFVSFVALTGFLGWSLVAISRVKREIGSLESKAYHKAGA